MPYDITKIPSPQLFSMFQVTEQARYVDWRISFCGPHCGWPLTYCFSRTIGSQPLPFYDHQ